WYQHDGAPPHYAYQVRAYLNHAFSNRWIGRNEPILWPPRSPDLMSPDFFAIMVGCNNSFMTHLKSEVPQLITLHCICHSSKLIASKACAKLLSSCEEKSVMQGISLASLIVISLLPISEFKINMKFYRNKGQGFTVT
ncbi:hypothetical protein X777_16312, partial [Ooceraea biroi]